MKGYVTPNAKRSSRVLKRVMLHEDEFLVAFALHRSPTPHLPTRKTPTPSESVIHPHVNVPEFGSEEFYAFVRAENARLNGEA